MALTIGRNLEARLRERALEEGCDPNELAEALLAAALDWVAAERAGAMAGIQRGLEAGAAGRVRPAAEIFAEMHDTLMRHSEGARLDDLRRQISVGLEASARGEVRDGEEVMADLKRRHDKLVAAAAVETP